MKKFFASYRFLFVLLFVSYGLPLWADNEEEVEEIPEYVFDDRYYNYIDTTRQKIDSVLDFKTEQLKSYQPRKKKTKYHKTKVREKQFDQTAWEKYNSERDYLEKQKKKKEPKENKGFEWPNWNLEGIGFLGDVLKILVYLVVALGIAFVIFKLLEAQYKQDQLLKKDKLLLIEKLEENIHEVDLYKLLEEYKQKQDFPMQIRIYYLIIVKELSNKGLIDWEIQKTNGNYIQELYGHTFFEPFKKRTLIFERVWFGEILLDKSKFEQTEPLFSSFIKQIKALDGTK